MISFNRTQDLHFFQNFEKIVATAPPWKLLLTKIILKSHCKISILHTCKILACKFFFKHWIIHEKFCMIPCYRIWDRTTIRILGEKKGIAAPLKTTCTQIASLLFLIVYILFINFCATSLTRNQDQRIPKILEKVKLQRNLLRNFFQKIIDSKFMIR